MLGSSGIKQHLAEYILLSCLLILLLLNVYLWDHKDDSLANSITRSRLFHSHGQGSKNRTSQYPTGEIRPGVFQTQPGGFTTQKLGAIVVAARNNTDLSWAEHLLSK
jgi:hypothetical protein